MTDNARPQVRVLVCGNIDRCDDGAAIWAAREMQAGAADGALAGVDVRQCGQLDVIHVLDLSQGVPLVIIDCAAGVDGGRIVTLPLDELLANPRGPAPHSSHALPIDQVLGLARALSDGPIDGLFVGIGGVDFGFGRTFSTAVRKALPEYISAIGAAIERLAAQPATAGA
jgi:hydrogenase maturation protease